MDKYSYIQYTVDKIYYIIGLTLIQSVLFDVSDDSNR